MQSISTVYRGGEAMERMALIVGVDYYSDACVHNLSGCVNDAKEVARLLRCNGDSRRSRNFDCKELYATDANHAVNRATIKDEVSKLFKSKAEITLFYFSGHGYIEATGGFINGSDSTRGDEGFSLRELVYLANKSPARHRVIMLDSCYSGSAGSIAGLEDHTAIAEGVTILTASRNDQVSVERDGHGVFTMLLINALEGAAADLTGKITPGSVYAHIDQSLGMWSQRPVFKTNTDSFISLREVDPSISLDDLRCLKDLFPEIDYEYHLDPSYEPRNEGRTSAMPQADPEHNRVFSKLQAYNRHGLLVPVGTDHMWNAAMESRSCRLTLLGRHYWTLAFQGRL